MKSAVPGNSQARARRVLYVQYTNPGAYPPLEHSALLLAQRGWRVVFLGVGSGGAGSFGIKAHPSIEVRLVSGMRPGWRQKLHYAIYCVWATWTAWRWGPEWIYASDPLAALPGLLAAKAACAQLLYHEHDSPHSEIMAARHPVMRLRAAAASRAVAAILPNATRAKTFVQTTGVDPGKVLCVWNCPLQAEASGTAARDWAGGARIWIYYHGSVNSSRLPLALARALAKLPERVGLRVVGYETDANGYLRKFQSAAMDLGIAAARLELLGPLANREDIFEVMSRSHIGLALVPLKTSDVNMLYMAGASNKPFDYLACAMPILVSRVKEWEDMFVAPGVARACDPEDPDSIRSEIAWYLDHLGQAMSMGEKGRALVSSSWNYERQFAPALAVLENESLQGAGKTSSARHD